MHAFITCLAVMSMISESAFVAAAAVECVLLRGQSRWFVSRLGNVVPDKRTVEHSDRSLCRKMYSVIYVPRHITGALLDLHKLNASSLVFTHLGSFLKQKNIFLTQIILSKKMKRIMMF